MTASSERTIREVERRYVDATGSDDFDVPAVIGRGRQALGLTRGTPEQLLDVAVRAIDGDETLTDDERAAAKRRAASAVGL